MISVSSLVFTSVSSKTDADLCPATLDVRTGVKGSISAGAEPLHRLVHVERRRVHGSHHQALIVAHNGLAIASRRTVRLGRLSPESVFVYTI